MIRAGGFPLSRVRLEILENHGKTMRQVWAGLSRKPALLLNGPFFDWGTMRATCHMKIHGKIICKPNYTEWGWAWNDGEAPEWCRLPCDRDNYFTNTVVLVGGTARKNVIWHADADGTPSKPRYTSRPATGQKDTRFMYYLNSCCSLPGLRDALTSAGWTHGMVGDGGGSTEGKTAEWEWYSSRKVAYYILVYLADCEPEGEKPMVEINAYSKEKDGDKCLSEHFAVKEFACKDGSDAVLVAPRLVMILQSVRSYFASPAKVLSAYRTPQYNAQVGGVAHSQHCYGAAADIAVKGHTPEEVADYARKLMPDWGGVGIYHDQGFTHIDVRESKADWKG